MFFSVVTTKQAEIGGWKRLEVVDKLLSGDLQNKDHRGGHGGIYSDA